MLISQKMAQQIILQKNRKYREIEPAGLYLCMYVAPTLNSEDRYAKWSKNASMLQLLAYIYKDNWMHPENTIEC